MTRVKARRDETIETLRKRDGDNCAFPGCKETLDFSIDDESRMQVTVDHWIPQWWCYENDWTYEEVWDFSNLRLMHKKCNAKKGERVPNEDGSLPARVTKQFKLRRQKRANRPDGPCKTCNNGHAIDFGDVCEVCGVHGKAFNIDAKAKASECDHDLFWCWCCSIGIVERPPAIVKVLDGEYLDE